MKVAFDSDYPTMGTVDDVVRIIAGSSFSMIGHFTLPDEAWWDDFYTPMEIQIEKLRGKYGGSNEALAVLDQIAREPEMHRRHADCYAYEFFVVRRMNCDSSQAKMRASIPIT